MALCQTHGRPAAPCVFLDGQAGASFVLGTVVRMQTIVVNGQLR